jgi:H+-transporting ATPase
MESGLLSRHDTLCQGGYNKDQSWRFRTCGCRVVKRGRTTYQGIVTWVLNKIVKTFQVAVFLTLGFIVTGYYLLLALDIILFLFLIDFVTISLSTDSMHGSKNHEKCDIRNLGKIGISVGAIQVLEMFIILFVGITYLDLGNNIGVMYTFFFTEIMFFGLLTPIIVRENDFFWKSAPGRTFIVSIIGEMVVVSILSLFGFGIVEPVTLIDFVFILSYGLFMNLLVNDVFKVLLKKVGLSR